MVWEKQTDGGRRIQTAILTHSFFFSWSYHTVLSSRSQLAPLLLLGWGEGYSTRDLLWSAAPEGCSPCLLAASCEWLKTHSPHISCVHLHISFHNTHIQPHDCFWLTAWSRVNMQQKFKIYRKFTNKNLINFYSQHNKIKMWIVIHFYRRSLRICNPKHLLKIYITPVTITHSKPYIIPII